MIDIRKAAAEHNIKAQTLQRRLRHGWDLEKALNTPVKTRKSQLSKDVQPIRSLEQLNDMKWALKRYCSQRDYIMFVLGINTGLRAGDLLRLTIGDVKSKRKAKIKEGKTGKMREIHLSSVYDELNEYIASLPKSSKWLFPSRKGEQPISVIHAWRQLNLAAQYAGLESIGTHTMRKTFGYWFYKSTKDIAQLQAILNHSHPQITLGYIGITSEQIEDNLKDFKL